MKKHFFGMSLLWVLGSSTAWAELAPLPYQDFPTVLREAIQTGDGVQVKNLPSYLCAEPGDVHVALTYLTEGSARAEILALARCAPLTVEHTIRIQKVYSYSIAATDSCYAYVVVIVDSQDVHLILDARDSTQSAQAVPIKNGARWVVRTNVDGTNC
ncbi:MAG: hypothetical protein RLZZ234_616 [Candidatus Parcubacteria bacterium]|jgi:hypothetical protein